MSKDKSCVNCGDDYCQFDENEEKPNVCPNWQPKESDSPIERMVDRVVEKFKKEAPQGTGLYVAGWYCEDSQLWVRIHSSEPKPIKKLVEHWIEGNHNNYDSPLKVCQYEMNPHSLQPVEEEKEESTPGPWQIDKAAFDFHILGMDGKRKVAEVVLEEDAKLIVKAYLMLEFIPLMDRINDDWGENARDEDRDELDELLTKMKAND